jgi:hypothetical protein
MPSHQPPEPWRSFLLELDADVSEKVDFQCLGGFVVTQLYGLQRPTSDVDVLSIAPVEQLKHLIEKGGKNSELHQKHRIYLDYVGIVSVPYDYDTRLIEMYPGTYSRLRLFALEAHDLALTKLSRNIAVRSPSASRKIPHRISALCNWQP